MASRPCVGKRRLVRDQDEGRHCAERQLKMACSSLNFLNSRDSVYAPGMSSLIRIPHRKFRIMTSTW